MRTFEWMMVVAVAGTALASGCTIDVGPGQIAPFVLEEEVDLAQADGITAPDGMTSFSMGENIEFLSAAAAADLDRRYGGKLKAVEAIDVRLDDLSVRRADGTEPPGMALVIVLDGLPLTVGERTRLPKDWIGRLRQAVRGHEALTGPLQYTLTVRSDDAKAVLTARATVQPFMVVDIGKAL
jgi:hypothetical protein